MVNMRAACIIHIIDIILACFMLGLVNVFCIVVYCTYTNQASLEYYIIEYRILSLYYHGIKEFILERV